MGATDGIRDAKIHVCAPIVQKGALLDAAAGSFPLVRDVLELHEHSVQHITSNNIVSIR